MRLAHVIIKLKTRRNLVEFLLANNLRVSLAGVTKGPVRTPQHSPPRCEGTREACARRAFVKLWPARVQKVLKRR